MKSFSKLILLSVFIFGVIACNVDDSEMNLSDSMSLEELGEINRFSSFDSYFSNDAELKSAKEGFVSLQNIFELMEELQEDSLNLEKFNMYLDDYREYIYLNEHEDLVPVISDLKLFSVLNTDGRVIVNNECYEFKHDRIIVYELDGTSYVKRRVEDRQISTESFLKSSTHTVSGTGNWFFEFGPYKVSDHRRVTVYKSVEYNGSFGIYVGGRIYYKKKGVFGGWKRCSTDLRMQYQADAFEYNAIDGSVSTKSDLDFISTCDDNHQLSAGVTYSNASSQAKKWKLDAPVVKFWRSKDGSGTCYVFEQIK